MKKHEAAKRLLSFLLFKREIKESFDSGCAQVVDQL